MSDSAMAMTVKELEVRFDRVMAKQRADGCPAAAAVADIASKIPCMPQAPVLNNQKHGTNMMLGNRDFYLATAQVGGDATAPIVIPCADHCATVLSSGGGKSIGFNNVGPVAVERAVASILNVDSFIYEHNLRHLCVDLQGNLSSAWTDNSVNGIADLLKKHPLLFRSDGNMPEGRSIIDREERAASSQETVQTMKLWDCKNFELSNARINVKRAGVMSNVHIHVQEDPIGKMIVAEKKSITGALFRWNLLPTGPMPFDYMKHQGASYDTLFGTKAGKTKAASMHPMLERSTLYLIASFITEHVYPVSILQHYADELETAKEEKARLEKDDDEDPSQESTSEATESAKRAKRAHRAAVTSTLDAMLAGQEQPEVAPIPMRGMPPAVTPAPASTAAAAAADGDDESEMAAGAETSSTGGGSTTRSSSRKGKGAVDSKGDQELSLPAQRRYLESITRRTAPMDGEFGHDLVCAYMAKWQATANTMKCMRDPRLANLCFGVAIKVKDHALRAIDDLRGMGDAHRLITYAAKKYNLFEAKNFDETIKILTTAQVNRPLNSNPSLKERCKAHTEAVAPEEYTVDHTTARLVHRSGMLVIETSQAIADIAGEYQLARIREDGNIYPKPTELQQTEQELDKQLQEDLAKGKAAAADAAAASSAAEKKLIKDCMNEVLKKPLFVSAVAEYASSKYKDVIKMVFSKLHEKNVGFYVDLAAGSQTTWQGAPYSATGKLKAAAGPTSFFLKKTTYADLETSNALLALGITESTASFEAALYPGTIPPNGARARHSPPPTPHTTHVAHASRLSPLAVSRTSLAAFAAGKNAIHLTKISTWLTVLARASGNSAMLETSEGDLILAAKEVHKMSDTKTSWGGGNGLDEPKVQAIVISRGRRSGPTGAADSVLLLLPRVSRLRTR